MPHEPPKRHIRLDSGHVIATDKHHGVWISASNCTGVALHHEGTPGVVVAHRGSLSRKNARSEHTKADLATLNRSQVLDVGARLSHPDDMITLMRGAAIRFGDPAMMTLSILPGVFPDTEVMKEVAESARAAKKKGLIADFRIVRPRKRQAVTPMVNAIEGTAQLKPHEHVWDRLKQEPSNYEWEE